MGQSAFGCISLPASCDARAQALSVAVARHVLEAEAPFGEIDVANCALIRAARDGDVNELKHAVEAGADINTHLPVWIRIGSPEDIDVMGPPYGDVEWIDSRASALGSGFTPLMHASHEGHHEVVKLLLRLGASMHNRDTDGMQALHLAAQVGSLECFRALVEAGSDPLSLDELTEEAVKLLLRLGASVHDRDTDGMQALHLAAQSGSFECFRALVEAGSDPLSLDEFNRTAIECAPSGMAQHACLTILKERAGVSLQTLVEEAAEVVDTKEVGYKVAATVAGAAAEVAEGTEMDRDASSSEETTADQNSEIMAANFDVKEYARSNRTPSMGSDSTQESLVYKEETESRGEIAAILVEKRPDHFTDGPDVLHHDLVSPAREPQRARAVLALSLVIFGNQRATFGMPTQATSVLGEPVFLP
eukprot:CAMPEP_0172929100 /NCGR_PEP_ID=MMETSP1075-20121228/218311_1 /TAXON_ID=2916 /ORGANISM="Ceratium fusus, Strain PA161109" /LENGTH=419 /DNA_ID=CAMNT_0013790389 /DNA_START=46 /DNA_END=1307 /DNA_ORIENTATION=+